MLPLAYVARGIDVPPAPRPSMRLVVLDRGEAFLALAGAALERGDVVGFRIEVRRVQDILVEAVQNLDADAEGAIAVNLARLTDFLLRHLDVAGEERSVRHLDEVRLAYGRVTAAYRDLARRRAGA